MLAQFQARYPTGSLISELLTIYQGKFVVRVSAQVEGVLRATGMAASDSLELAEDQARSRALMVLGIQQVTSAQSMASAAQPATNPVQRQSEETMFSPEPMKQLNQSRSFATTTELNDPTYSPISQPPPVEEAPPAPEVSPEIQGKSDAYGKDSVQGFSMATTHSAQEADAIVDNLGMMSSPQTPSSSNPPISFSNVTPLVPRNYSPPEGTETEMRASEPVDLSDAIARTSIELKRLRWSNQQGREYLERAYGKRSRQQLTDEEMLAFLHYLESQPSP